jgi:ferredoxin-type protein NapH
MTAKRQRVRKAIMFCLFLTFPISMNYFSPVLIAMGASDGIINGSFIVFGVLLIAALFLGRAFCGWVCPIGGLQEACFMVNDKRINSKRIDWIKWVIWGPWIGLIIFIAIRSGGYKRIQPLFLMENGISVSEPSSYIMYLMVLMFFVLLALTVGRRAFCHTMCWIAPFMILGRKLRNTLRWPSLRLKPEKAKCISCKKCTESCPMSLDVNSMVQSETMDVTECILCGTCVDTCPKSVISYSFSVGR